MNMRLSAILTALVLAGPVAAVVAPAPGHAAPGHAAPEVSARASRATETIRGLVDPAVRAGTVTLRLVGTGKHVKGERARLRLRAAHGYRATVHLAPGRYRASATLVSGGTSYTTTKRLWLRDGQRVSIPLMDPRTTATHSVGFTLPDATPPIVKSTSPTVEAKPGELRGVVTDAVSGAPVGGACLFLYAPGAAAATYATCAQSDGTYWLGSIVPGEYRLGVADTDAHETTWLDVTVGPGATADVRLTPLASA